jgi:hypothetical protein
MKGIRHKKSYREGSHFFKNLIDSCYVMSKISLLVK